MPDGLFSRTDEGGAVVFREDECRIRAGHAGENFAVMRHIALNLLKAVKGTKVGVKNRRIRAG